jgi:hypothetical protein
MLRVKRENALLRLAPIAGSRPFSREYRSAMSFL